MVLSNPPNEMRLASALDECVVRFLLLLPEEEYVHERLLMNIEKAHWFYMDFLQPASSRLPNLKFYLFCRLIFKRPAMQKFVQDNANIGTIMREYKRNIPRTGLVVLNKKQDKVLLVQSMNTKSYMLPQGKLDESETPLEAAIREGKEEIGYDCSPYLQADKTVYYEDFFSKQFFMCVGVPENAKFETQTRGEISDIKWFKFDEIDNKMSWHVVPILEKYGLMGEKKLENKSEKKSVIETDSSDSSSSSEQSDTESILSSLSSISKSKVRNSNSISTVKKNTLVSSSKKIRPTNNNNNSNTNNNGTIKKPSIDRMKVKILENPNMMKPTATNKKPAQPTQSRNAAILSNNNTSASVPRRSRKLTRFVAPKSVNAKSCTSDDDLSNILLGGNSDSSDCGWSVEDMFKTNQRITGQKYLYDGKNPNEFGSDDDVIMKRQRSANSNSPPLGATILPKRSKTPEPSVSGRSLLNILQSVSKSPLKSNSVSRMF
eukprot:TRINITY_DN190_c0_g1_i2.p1 TRINITY_DN190_c0_g1~~TRINITY_DN190_c0_g1_i2.p1  ORF type:complete len:489 (-),score=132.10 TRINITY_DN190_c0_g1_i2:1790-3256(-)